MAKLKLQNRTRNPYKVPMFRGEIDRSDRMIPAGMTGEIEAEKHAGLMKSNKAYRAMLETGKLRSSALDLGEVAAEELGHTSDPEKPADLLESPEAKGAEGPIEATVKSQGVEVVEAPVEELTPAQKGAATRAARKAGKSSPPARR